MELECLFYLALFIFSTEADQNYKLTVQYNEEVIEQAQAEALVYPLPENAYDYEPATANENITEYGTFDYIIVGAGAAGAVIATRLSEERQLKILLIEAGGHENSFSDIPGMLIYLRGLRFNWNYKSTPQTTCCLGMIKNECPLPRGKALGGSTVINALMYVRGNKHDFDSWEKEGNRGWSYNDVLPYFIKSENSQIHGDPGYHGKGGLLNVEYHRPYSPEFYAFIDANLELGRKVVDYNGKDQLGVARVQLNNIDGKRDSTGRAFLPTAQSRENLTILINSLVTKVLIDKRKKVAQGVQFSNGRSSFIAKASKEVIISAGAFGSPQLLMLSGIGPAKHLQQHGIPVIKNLSVGENYQDHATFYGLLFSSNYTEPTRSLTENVEGYLQNYGPLTIAGNSQGLGFYQTNLTKVPGVPDIELIIIPANATNDFIKKALHYTNETWDSVWARVDTPRTFTFYVILLHPKSRGTVKLKSSNPYDYPLIDTNFLSDPKGEDIETLYAGIQLSLEIINTKAFKKLNASLFYAPLPACKQHDYLSKAYWYCQLRHLTMHIYHPVGTCKMGKDPSKGAVVDNKLRVHGIKRLRVADASIFPHTTSGHMSAPSIMIGEKLSDMLLKKRFNQCRRF